VVNGVSPDEEKDDDDDDDDDSPLLQNSINGPPNYQAVDNSNPPNSDRVVQVVTRPAPECINTGIV